MTTQMETPKVYVGTYAKYNDGSIEGDWLDLTDYTSKEEFYEACRELHADEEDPEFMFQDYENIPEAFISESHIEESFWEYLNAIADFDDERLEAMNAFCDLYGYDLTDDTSSIVSKFEEAYQGHFDGFNPRVDFAEQLVDDCYELSDFAKQYFDYEKFARDLFMSDYDEQDGHIFRSDC